MESDSVFDERSSSINPHYEKKPIYEKTDPLLVGVAVVPRNAEANARDSVPRYLSRPLAVDRLRPPDARRVERQIGDIDPVAAAHEARGKQQPDVRAVAHPVEIPDLGDDLSGLVGHHDLVGLIGAHPDVIV